MSVTDGGPYAFPFIVIWEFRVRPGKRRAFEKAYGPGGEWARVVARQPDHIRTELIRDRERPLCYLTLDFWKSRLAYERFIRQKRPDYMHVSKRCSGLTVQEKLVGTFDNLRPVEPASMALEIRPATKVDVPEMIRLAKQSASAAQWPESAYQTIFDQPLPTRLAFALQGRDGKVEGFVVAALGDEECELENIVVVRHRRGAGWGKRLLTEVMAAARSRKAKRIFLEVRESVAAARRLYLNCGFQCVGRRPGYYQNPIEDAILYRLEL